MKRTKHDLYVMRREAEAGSIRAGANLKTLERFLKGSEEGLAKDGTYFEYVASTNAFDRHGESIRVAGWTWPTVLPKLQDSHNTFTFKNTVGRLTEIQKQTTGPGEDHALVVRGVLADGVGHPDAVLLAAMMEQRFIEQGSVGFIPMEWTNPDKSVGTLDRDGWPWPLRGRSYDSQELVEFSVVAAPSNRDSVLRFMRDAGRSKRAAGEAGKMASTDPNLDVFLKTIRARYEAAARATDSGGSSPISLARFVGGSKHDALAGLREEVAALRAAILGGDQHGEV